MAKLRLFGPAREAAGLAYATVPGGTVSAVLDQAQDRYGSSFTSVLKTSRVWLNGQPATPETSVDDDDEVAVIPPVSGG